MKPRTVYEKAVQDFTETARRLAKLDQHVRQASFAEFKILMAFETFDDEALKRYRIVEADGRAGAHQSVSNRRAWSAEKQGSLLMAVLTGPGPPPAGTFFHRPMLQGQCELGRALINPLL